MNKKEIKLTARKNGININSIKRKNGGYSVNYYNFNSNINYRTENKKTFFLSENELISFAENLS